MEQHTFNGVILPLLSGTPSEVIQWMKENKLLIAQMQCNGCTKDMHWTRYKRCQDGFIWKCQTKNCPRYQHSLSVRKDSFFSHSNLPLHKWVYVMYLWSEHPSETKAYRQVSVSEKSMIDFYNFFRGVCTRYFEQHPIQLGGPGVRIEVDDSCFIN